MDEIFLYNKLVTGVKGLVFIGDEILVYRRDNNTDKFPMMLDLPGGGIEGEESPFEIFEREVAEEFGLKVGKDDIVYAKQYKGTEDPTKLVYFLAAKLPASARNDIVFGDEGLEYMLMTLSECLAKKDAWSLFQERAAEYQSVQASK